MRTLIVVLIVVVALAAGGLWYWSNASRGDTLLRTVKVRKGDIVSTIDATGTLEPEEVIDVGAQVAGLIQSFGKDANGKQIDYRSPVEENMVLAQIDDAVYRADVDTANAQVQAGNANLQKAKADLETANAKLFQAEQNWNRAKNMGPSEALSQQDYEMYRADYLTAKANITVSEALIAQAEASVSQAQAALTKAKRNLEFCTIKSPVKGVIIDRRVNVGQTVVSSLNAPSLFLIAKDLTRMQIWVAVNEADVGRIAPNTPVKFWCDTFPDQQYEGRVGKVRLNATMTQNVVMYTVEVEADNPGSQLLPYLTTKVQFQVQKEADALNVPNAALRWYPTSASQVAPEFRAQWKPLEDTATPWGSPPPGAPAGGGGSGAAGAAPAENPNAAGGQPAAGNPEGAARGNGGGRGQGMGGGGGGGRRRMQQSASAATMPAKDKYGMVWVKEGEFAKPVKVKLGVSDRTYTVISAPEISEGTEVVIGEATQAAADGADQQQRNPFLPQMPRRR